MCLKEQVQRPQEALIRQVWKDKIEGQKPQLLGTGINTAEPSLSPEARILI